MLEASPPSLLCPITVGRDRELALLGERLERRADGVLLLAGDAGVGKTRLVRETTGHARRLGYRVLLGACFEPDRALPYAPLLDLLRNAAGAVPPADLVGWAGSHAPALARLLPELTPLVEPGQAGSGDEPNLRRRHLFEAVTFVLARAAGDGPLLVVIEDLHWSDEGTLDFLLFLARRPPPRPTLLLLTFRPEEVGAELAHALASFDRERSATELSVAGLNLSEVDQMIRATLGLARPTPADFLHLISTLTDGNPFFVEEILKTLDLTEPSPAGWDIHSFDVPRLPRSVQDAVGRRVTRLSPSARRALEVAAIAGRRFDFGLLVELTALDEAALLGALKEAITAQLVVEESAERFAFRHELTRQAVAAGLLTRERIALHRAIAEALELSSHPSDPPLADLADHYFAAGVWDKAVQYAWRAGQMALALDAPPAAVAHLTRALTAARQIPAADTASIHQARARAYETLGDFDHALADGEEALVLAERGGDPVAACDALLALGQLWASRDYARTDLLYHRALDLARATQAPALLARTLNSLGNWHVNNDQPATGSRHHAEALALFEAIGDRHGVAATRDLLGLASVIGGDVLQGAVHYQRAVDLWRPLGDRRGLASSLAMFAVQGPSFHTDTVPVPSTLMDSQAACEEAIAIARAIGWRAGESWVLWTHGGLCLGAHGDYRRALPDCQAALEIAEEIEHRQWIVGASVALGNMHADLLAFASGRWHLERGLTIAREIASPYWVHSATGWLASNLVRQGQLEAAKAILAAELTVDTPLAPIACRLLWVASAELALAGGEPGRALALADRLIASAPNASPERPIARLEKLRGEALAALGQADAAVAALVTARETAAAQGMRPLHWRINLALAPLWRTVGRPDEADRAIADGRALIAELAAGVADDDLRAGFLTGTAALFPRPSPGFNRRAAAAEFGGLTEREREVAALLTRGTSNRAIAASLFVSEWTVATHVRNILAKLDFSTRTQIAAWAIERGLGTPPPSDPPPPSSPAAGGNT